MATQYANGKIVTDGLVLALDAADRNSYVSGSLIWNDNSGNGNSGSLVNGPTYSSADGGSIVFDGVDDYVNCGNNSTILSITNQVTWGGFVKFTQLSNYRRFLTKDNGTQGVIEIFYNTVANRFDVEVVTSTGRTSSRSTTIPAINNVYHLIGTYDGSNIKIYVNGVLENTTVKTGDIVIGSGGGIYLGNTPITPSNFYLVGNIYQVQIYNRALSASEVLQNYNAQKSRFGLK